VRCGNLFDRFSMLEFKIDTESFQMLVVSFVEKIGKRPSQYTIVNYLGKVKCKYKQRTPNKISQLTRMTRVQIQFAAKYYQNMIILIFDCKSILDSVEVCIYMHTLIEFKDNLTHKTFDSGWTFLS
jgi:hypothetical protein